LTSDVVPRTAAATAERRRRHVRALVERFVWVVGELPDDVLDAVIGALVEERESPSSGGRIPPSPRGGNPNSAPGCRIWEQRAGGLTSAIGGQTTRGQVRHFYAPGLVRLAALPHVSTRLRQSTRERPSYPTGPRRQSIGTRYTSSYRSPGNTMSAVSTARPAAKYDRCTTRTYAPRWGRLSASALVRLRGPRGDPFLAVVDAHADGVHPGHDPDRGAVLWPLHGRAAGDGERLVRGRHLDRLAVRPEHVPRHHDRVAWLDAEPVCDVEVGHGVRGLVVPGAAVPAVGGVAGER
jgi:hypothetical protein